MTDHPPPASPSGADPAAAYGRLDPRVQRWVYEQKWDRLRAVQAHAVDPVLAGRDVVIAAATASGKTEAAWLPVFTRIAPRDRLRDGLDEFGTDRTFRVAQRGARGAISRDPMGRRLGHVFLVDHAGSAASGTCIGESCACTLRW